MDDVDVSEPSEFQQTLSRQIASYEADLTGLRLSGAAPDEISTFESIVEELRRLQLEDLAELACAALWRGTPATDRPRVASA